MVLYLGLEAAVMHKVVLRVEAAGPKGLVSKIFKTGRACGARDCGATWVANAVCADSVYQQPPMSLEVLVAFRTERRYGVVHIFGVSPRAQM